MGWKRTVLKHTSIISGTSFLFNYFYYNDETRRVGKRLGEVCPELDQVDFKGDSKVTRIQRDDVDWDNLPSRAKAVLYDVKWEGGSPVEVVEYNGEDSKSDDEPQIHYYVGGLQSLFACVRKLEEVQGDSKQKCFYVHDGKPFIAQRAGMQLHEHPTQFPDYGYFELFGKFLQFINVWPEQKPERWDYSPLHIKFDWFHPISCTRLYLSFFVKKVWHSWTNEDRVSVDDYRLILLIRDSLQKMRDLDPEIYELTGRHIVTQHGRFYWSPDYDEIKKKRAHWGAMGIKTEITSEEYVEAHTLLDARRHQIHSLKMEGDGEIHPDLPEIVVDYLQKKYPDQFEFHQAALTKLFVDKNDTVQKVEECAENEAPRQYAVASTYASLGHDRVKRKEKKLYDLVPTSGVTSDWRVTIPKAELEQRVQEGLEETGLTFEEYLEERYMVPTADMYNLHVKMVDYEMKGDDVVFYSRVTEGAKMFSTHAEKRDLLNMAYKLNRFFVGKWDLLAAGTCTRQTSVPNRPEVFGCFRFGQSGVGISTSAGQLDEVNFKDGHRGFKAGPQVDQL